MIFPRQRPPPSLQLRNRCETMTKVERRIDRNRWCADSAKSLRMRSNAGLALLAYGIERREWQICA